MLSKYNMEFKPVSFEEFEELIQKNDKNIQKIIKNNKAFEYICEKSQLPLIEAINELGIFKSSLCTVIRIKYIPICMVYHCLLEINEYCDEYITLSIEEYKLDKIKELTINISLTSDEKLLEISKIIQFEIIE